MKQEENFKLKKFRLAAMPLVNSIMAELGVRSILGEVIDHERHIDAIEILIKNILLTRSALYRVNEWASAFDPILLSGTDFNDDLLARSLDKLFRVDRASLQTRFVLEAIKRFKIDTDTIHNDSTSISGTGEYRHQDSKAVQLKQGHSKDHRPDLKQIIFNLSVSADGAIPIHFKSYDGNRTDDTTHWETWLTLRGILGRANFLYVADCKLCTSENMQNIDRSQGRFITIVPRTREETKQFASDILKGTVRWKFLWRKRSSRHVGSDDKFYLASGLWQLREGYRICWYRSVEKMRRDEEDRDQRINRVVEKLSQLACGGKRGPRTEKSLLTSAQKVIEKHRAENWISAEIVLETEQIYKKTSPGRSGPDATYKLIIKKKPQLGWLLNEDGIAESKAMDGIFPLTTNTDIQPLDVLKHYKYQPRLEKRFSFLKSVADVAPIFLKKNERIEALMFIHFLVMLLAALFERKLRQNMAQAGIKFIHTLPEERPTATPTWEQMCRLFEGLSRSELYDGTRKIKSFHDQLTKSQKEVLDLIGMPDSAYQ